MVDMDQAQKERGEALTPAPADGTREGNGKPPVWRRRPVIVLGTLLLFGLLFYGLRYLSLSLTHESTDDAFLAADVVSVAPKVAGRVQQVHISENQLVHTGDVLVELDPRDFQVALDQKRSAVKAAQANVDLLKAQVQLSQAQVVSAEATAKQTSAEVAAAQATSERAAADLKRAQDLIKNRTISPQEFDTSQAAANATEANLRAAREKAASDRAKVGEAEATVETARKALDHGEALVHQADWDRQAAELNLSYTRLTAPTNGYVTKKSVAEGDYVQVAQKLMALVPDQGIYVLANFKETQLQALRPGQTVEITIDSVSQGPFAGQVQSIMAGSGAAFSLLPPENAVGNYVKVVQRVGVKIVFDHPPEAKHVLGPGMSVVPTVRVKSFSISEALVLIAAAVLALSIGVIWWVAAGKRRA
jgi:membrane fusion protein, multidrug efflux system